MIYLRGMFGKASTKGRFEKAEFHAAPLAGLMVCQAWCFAQVKFNKFVYVHGQAGGCTSKHLSYE